MSSEENKKYWRGLTTEMRLRVILTALGIAALALMPFVSHENAKRMLLPVLILTFSYWVLSYFIRRLLFMLCLTKKEGSLLGYTFMHLEKNYPLMFKILILLFLILIFYAALQY